MLREERKRPFARQVGAGGVVVLAFVAIEAVAGRIGVDGRLRDRGADAVDGRGGDMLVALAEMEHERSLRRLVQEVGDIAAVVADGGRDREATGRKPGDVAAPAVAD